MARLDGSCRGGRAHDDLLVWPASRKGSVHSDAGRTRGAESKPLAKDAPAPRCSASATRRKYVIGSSCSQFHAGLLQLGHDARSPAAGAASRRSTRDCDQGRGATARSRRVTSGQQMRAAFRVCHWRREDCTAHCYGDGGGATCRACCSQARQDRVASWLAQFASAVSAASQGARPLC